MDKKFSGSVISRCNSRMRILPPRCYKPSRLIVSTFSLTVIIALLSSVNCYSFINGHTTLRNCTWPRHDVTGKAPLSGGGGLFSRSAVKRRREHVLVTMSLWSNTVCCPEASWLALNVYPYSKQKTLRYF